MRLLQGIAVARIKMEVLKHRTIAVCAQRSGCLILLCSC